MDRDADYLSQYKALGAKLKKRNFLKKPNYTEIGDQFGELGKTFKNQECPQYAALCVLSQARCEHSLGSIAGEAHNLVESARLFVTAHAELENILCPNFEEHLTAAINCYGHAIRVYVENKKFNMAAGLCLELGLTLQKYNRHGEAIQHLLKAAELQIQSPIHCLQALEKVVSCRLRCKDYTGSLDTLTEMAVMITERVTHVNGRPLGPFCDVMKRCEVLRVLLLMLLKPTPQRIRPEHAQLLEKYCWESPDDVIPVKFMSSDQFLLLQSLVMACQANDVTSLEALDVELRPFLTSEQQDLLCLIVKHEMDIKNS